MKSENEIRKAIEHFRDAHRGAINAADIETALASTMVIHALEWALGTGVALEEIIEKFRLIDSRN